MKYQTNDKNITIPTYTLNKFRTVHRLEDDSSSFGYNTIEKSRMIEGFELYSSEGLVGSVGPLKSEFYRISITVSGTLDMRIGLDYFRHQPRTMSFTYPNEIFSKNNISADAFGYYMLFQPGFLDELIPSLKLAQEFPFFDFMGTPLFQLSQDELNNVLALVMKINDELQHLSSGRIKAVQMYLYLILLEAKRSYERQQLQLVSESSESQHMVTRFRKLVGLHYLSKRQVSDYATMLSVSPNHLNRIVKEITGKTASNNIKEMLLQEAKLLLRYTDSTVSEIAYQLDFSDPTSFNRFFKMSAKETPSLYRSRHN